MPSSIPQKLGSFFSGFAARYAPAIITMLVLAAGFYYYFHVVVSGNESDLKERNFRGLNRMAVNIAGKVNDYANRNAGNFLSNLSASNEAGKKAGYDLEDTILSGPADTLRFFVRYSEGWNLMFKPKASTPLAKDSTANATAYAIAQKFVATLLRRDLFSHYLLAAGDTILFDELDISHQNLSTYLPGNFAKDSLHKEQIRAGEIREVNIGGNEYKLFLLSFIVEGKTEFKIGGYMPLEKYISEQRYIPTYAFLWLLIGIIVVLLMFPLLKIFLMQRSEQMLVNNAITPFASLHVIGAIVVLVAVNSYVHFNLVLLPASSDLKTLATNTESIFLHELDAALTEMDNAKAAVKKDTTLLADRLLSLQNRRNNSLVSLKVATSNFTIPYTYKPAGSYNYFNTALATMDSLRTVLKKKSPAAERLGFPFEKRNDTTGNFHTDSTNGSLAVYSHGEAYPYFKHLVWTDTLGQQQHRWTTNSYLSKRINISQRDYFKAVESGNLWLRNGAPYYFTVISSWVGNEKLAVIARPFFKEDAILTAKGLKMQSLSGDFRSMHDALLPEGYDFCIVKENGEVIFHNDENRSLNENLIEECTDNETLQTLLKTRSSGYTECRYAGSSKRFYVKAITGLPYSVVSFRDMRIMWSEGLDVISACSILCLMNLAVILLAILIIQASGFKHSLLQSQFILVGWLRPNKKRKQAYFSVTIFFLYSIVLQAFFFLTYAGADPLWLVGLAFSYSYILLANSYWQYAVLYEDDEMKKEQSKTPVYFLAAIYLFTAGIFVLNLKSEQWLYVISQAALLIPVLFGKLKLSEVVARNHFIQQKSFRWWYAVSLLAFIAATSITPLINFYLLSFKEERLLSLKQNQLDFANKFMQVPYDSLSRRHDSLRFSYNAPFHFQNFSDKITGLPQMPVSKDTSENSFEFLYKNIKPSFSAHSREIEFLIRRKDTATRDFFWHYTPVSRGLTLFYNTPKTQTYFPTPGIAIQSNLKSEFEDTQKAIKDDWISLLLLVGGLILSLWGFIHLLNRLIDRIFFKGYDASSHYFESDLPFINSLPQEENIFINGAVNSGKSRMLKGFLSATKKDYYEIDLAGLSPKEPVHALGAKSDEELKNLLPDDGHVIIVRHFELFMNDLASTQKKLVLLESLLRLKRQVVILSARSFDSMVIKTPDSATVAVDYTDRWSNVMNQFYNLYHRWKKPEKDDIVALKMQAYDALLQRSLQNIANAPKTRKSRPLQYAEKIISSIKLYLANGNVSYTEPDADKIIRYIELQLSDFLMRLDKECSHSDFLWDLRPTILTYIKKNVKEFVNFDFQTGRPVHQRKIMARHFTLLHEKICLKIQSLSANYYLAVWQSLNRDEQRTLYDIALDEMVNPANRDIASRLVDLGLVKRVPDIACYEVMNISFRNFIFTKLDKKEVSSLQADESGKGSWNSFQLPVLLVVIAIGIFLFTAQKDAFTNMITYLGAAATGIAALLRVLAVIPSSKS